MRLISGRLSLAILSLCFAALLWILGSSAKSNDSLKPKVVELPKENFDHPPKEAFDRSDYFFKLDQMEHFYRVPGEFGHRMWGEKYGFEALSFIITETHPGGGPRFHTHDVEEAHVLLKGSAKYRVGDTEFTVQAPYVAKVPAGMPHAFINTGSEPMNIIAVFPSKRPEVKILGPNPLIQQQAPAEKEKSR
jgi:mannose-6-phosphate isomerase-like protein (cupin superfamily)